MEHLEGKVAVVTGAASGIGLAMANRFGRAGMCLVLADIEPEPLEDAAAALRGHGYEVSSAACDVSDHQQVEALRDTAIDAFGAAHVVCNNAGVGTGGPMADVEMADWQWVLNVNLWGVINGINVFLPGMFDQGEGHFVNTASVAGLFSAPFMGPYNASKAAVVSLSETLFHELKMLNSQVGVSVLCPAWVRTRIHESHRNRPGGPGDSLMGDSNVAAVMAGFIEQGMDPAEVADAVLAAVVERRFYILTHPDSAQAVTARAAAITEGADPPFYLPQ